jgi:hypothetical protein
MHTRQIRSDRRLSLPRARAVVARAVAVSAVAGASLLMTAAPAAAQVGDPAYGAGPGVSAGQPTVAGQAPAGVVRPGVAGLTPGRASGGPTVPAQALPNTGGGPETPPTDWGMPAALAGLTLVGLVAVARRNLARGGRTS